MQFSPEFFTSNLLTAGWALFVLVMAIALWLAPWRAILAVPLRQHALFGALAVLCLIWSFRFEVMTGFHCHPFLIMSLTLIFGWSLTLLVGALALVLVLLLGGYPWQALPWDWVFTVLLPATLGFLLMRVLYRLRLRNLFFYILGLGFFGTIITTFLNCALVWFFLSWTQTNFFLDQLWEKSAVVVPLLYSEGFLNGVMVTTITVFMPNLVKTFDEHYFR